LHELEQAVQEGNAIGVRQAAHSLNGMVACFATKSAQGFAHDMENLGKAGDVSKASALLPTLLLEFARVMQYLKAADWQGKH
jgi:chemotaxis protein histidine kinase CheA